MNKVNVQGEINLHNLEVFSSVDMQGRSKPGLTRFLTIKGLFFLFWFVYCVLLPLFVKFWRFGADRIRRINLPVIPIRLGMIFLGNWIVYRFLRYLAEGDIKFTHTMDEIKECNFAFLFLLAALYFSLKRQDQVEPAAD